MISVINYLTEISPEFVKKITTPNIEAGRKAEKELIAQNIKHPWKSDFVPGFNAHLKEKMYRGRRAEAVEIRAKKGRYTSRAIHDIEKGHEKQEKGIRNFISGFKRSWEGYGRQ